MGKDRDDVSKKLCAEVPANTTQDELGLIVTPLKGIGIGHGEEFPGVQALYCITFVLFCNTTCKIGIGEVAFTKAGFTKSSVFKDGGSKINIIKASLSKNSIGEISPWHRTSLKTTFIHTGIDEFSKAQVTFDKPTGIEVGVGEVGLLVDSSSDIFIIPVRTSKIPATKVSFSPSTLSNQFFSIHDSKPQMIDRD